MKTTVTSFLLFTLFINCINAQVNIPKPYNNFVPASPEATALGKYGEMPVNLYNGLTEVNIPLYQIEAGGFNLPISLSYHASGIKVEQTESCVGLGWSLNAGGVITRSINGLPDEDDNGFVKRGMSGNRIPLPNQINLQNDDMFNLMSHYANGDFDGEPDYFYFNFGNNSGELFFDQDGSIHFNEYKPFKILENPISGNVNDWKLIDESGTLYIFGNEDRSLKGIEQSRSRVDGLDNQILDHAVTAWYLTKIITRNQDTIKLTYNVKAESYEERKPSSFRQLDTISGRNGTFPTCCYGEPYCNTTQQWNEALGINRVIDPATNTIHMSFSGYSKLSRIDWESGHIEFKSGTAFQDMIGTLLDSIVVYNQNSNIPVKKYALSYDFDHYRAYLEGIDLISSENSTLNLYSFQYYSGLPYRTSMAQDYWGYYNAATSNTHLIPLIPELVNPNNPGYTPADRDPNENMIKGSLKEIHYPTKGYTRFEYEPNQYSGGSGNGGITQNTTKSISVSAADKTYDFMDIDIPYAQIFSYIIRFDDYVKGVQKYTTPLPEVSLKHNGTTIQQWNAFDECTNGQSTITINGTYYGTGTFTFEVTYTCHDPDDCDQYNPKTSITVSYKELIENTYPAAGGIRIKKITNYQENGSFSSCRKFEYTDDQNNSTGKILNIPNKYFSEYRIYNFSGVTSICLIDCQFTDIIEYTSQNQTALGSTKGSSVGYERVTEYDIDSYSNAKGKTDYFYSFSPDTRNVNVPEFVPSTSKDYLRGKLLKQSIYVSNGSSYTLKKSIVNQYSFNDSENSPNMFSQTALRAKRCGDLEYDLNCNHNDRDIVLQYGHYNVISIWPVLTSTVTFNWENNKVIIDSVKYYYDNPSHAQVSRTETVTATGQRETEHILYSADFPDNSGFIYALKTNNILSPIEDLKYISDENTQNNKITSGIINIYDNRGNIVNQYSLESSSLIPISNFLFSNMTTIGTIPTGLGDKNFTISGIDQHYSSQPRIIYEWYDNSGRIKRFHKDKDMYTYYIWGYNNTLPIAEVKNATSSNSNWIAYTSFESSDDFGGWGCSGSIVSSSPAKTGKNYFLMSGTNSISRYLVPGTYYIEYWTKNSITLSLYSGTVTDILTSSPDANGWSYYKKKITVTSPSALYLSGTAYIDELRLYPVGAQMTTYTYDPLVGLTSSTDENNVTTYYEYDSFGRLARVKDQDGKVLKQYEYHYQNQ